MQEPDSESLGFYEGLPHVRKWYIFWPQSTYIGTTLRPKVYTIWVHGPVGFGA